MKYFDCTSKSIRNYLKLYGIPIRPNGEAVKLERSKWSDEKEKARSLKCMQTWKDTPEEIRNCNKNKIKLLLIYPKNNSYFVRDDKIENLGKINAIDINDID